MNSKGQQLVIELASQLVQITQELRSLQEKNRAIREQLCRVIPKNEPVEVAGATVRYVYVPETRKFSRKQVLEYIAEKYDETIAEAVDEDCTIVTGPHEKLNVRLESLEDEDS